MCPWHFAGDKPGGNGQYTRGSHCHLDELGQAGAQGRQEPHGVLTKERQSPSFTWGRGTPGASTGWELTDWEQLCQQDLWLWVTASSQEPAVHPPSKEGHQHPGLHHKSDPSTLLSTGETIPQVPGPVLHSSVGKRHGHTGESLANGPGQAALGDPCVTR